MPPDEVVMPAPLEGPTLVFESTPVDGVPVPAEGDVLMLGVPASEVPGPCAEAPPDESARAGSVVSGDCALPQATPSATSEAPTMPMAMIFFMTVLPLGGPDCSARAARAFSAFLVPRCVAAHLSWGALGKFAPRRRRPRFGLSFGRAAMSGWPFRLLDRTPRTVRVTERGRRFYDLYCPRRTWLRRGGRASP